MRITFYGTRGSTSVSSPDNLRFGGNTTCVRLESPLLPPGMALIIDAGTGFVPLGKVLVQEVPEITTIHLLLTHYHHDHTQGLLLSPVVYKPNVRFCCLGPKEHQVGPLQMLRHLMQPPYFPRTFTEVAHRFEGKGLEHPMQNVLAIHPAAGSQLLTIEQLYRSEQSKSRQLRFATGYYNLAECLIVRMQYAYHPERTISYRFEEGGTGPCFVFLTDHENTDDFPQALLQHARQADLLVMDAQYSLHTLHTRTAGYGHGTPEQCVRFAQASAARQLGLTHHDPFSDDRAVEGMIQAACATAQEVGYPGRVFACADYQVIDCQKS